MFKLLEEQFGQLSTSVFIKDPNIVIIYLNLV